MSLRKDVTDWCAGRRHEEASVMVSVCAGVANPPLDVHECPRKLGKGNPSLCLSLAVDMDREHGGEVNTGEIRGKLRSVRSRSAVGGTPHSRYTECRNWGSYHPRLRSRATHGRHHGASPHALHAVTSFITVSTTSSISSKEDYLLESNLLHLQAHAQSPH
jgi:hypothetical protein